MKKITLANEKAEVINFLVAGQRHSSNAVELTIDAEGVIAKDEHAAIVESRLGSQVKIEDIDVAEAKKEAEKAIKEAEKEAAKAEKEAEKAKKEAEKEAEKAKKEAAKKEADKNK